MKTMSKQVLKFETSPVLAREDDAGASGILDKWFSVSSEQPCKTSMVINDVRQDCYLVLSHDAASIDRQWIADGIQLRDGHGGDVVANAKPVAIRNGKLGGEKIVWGTSERARILAADYANGVRTGISVEGDYCSEDLSLEGEFNGLPLVRANRWACVAAAFVAVPADPTVGVNRSKEASEPIAVEKQSKKGTINKGNNMNTEKKDMRTGAESAEIFAMARQYDVPAERVTEWMTNGVEIGEIRGEILREYANKPKAANKATSIDKIGIDAGSIGMNEREINRYSFTRAILGQLPGSGVDSGFEREVSTEVARKFGKAPRGIYVPMDVMLTRAMSVASGAVGGYLVQTNNLGGSFIDNLKAKMVLNELGATFLPGLVGDITIPKKNASATGYWIADGEDVTEGAPSLGQVKLTPHCAGAYVDMTRQLLQQSNPAIDFLVQSDITDSLARVLQAAAFHGTNANNQPKGLAGWVDSISANTMTLTASATFADMAAAEGKVESDSVDGSACKFVMHPGAFATLRTTSRDEGSGKFVGEYVNGMKYAADAPCYTTTSVTSGNAFYGDFTNLLIGLWGALDITIDPYSLSKSGGLRIVGLQDCDIAVRHAEAFYRYVNIV